MYFIFYILYVFLKVFSPFATRLLSDFLPLSVTAELQSIFDSELSLVLKCNRTFNCILFSMEMYKKTTTQKT